MDRMNCWKTLLLLECLLLVLGSEDLAAAREGVGGIGVRIGIAGGYPTILEAADAGSAFQGGVQSGDIVLKIDGLGTEGMTVQQCVKAIAGPLGTQVTLTLRRHENEQDREFSVVLTRRSLSRVSHVLNKALPGNPLGLPLIPTKRAHDVEWKGNRVISRVLPYPDLMSFFIRLPIAHAAVTGQGVHVGIVGRVADPGVTTMVRRTAPDAEIMSYLVPSPQDGVDEIARTIIRDKCRVVTIYDIPQWSEVRIISLVKQLIAADVLVVVPSDLSEESAQIEAVNRLQGMGVLTVGRLNSQSMVLQQSRDPAQPFNRSIRRIHTDLFSTVGLESMAQSVFPVAATTGVAALVREKWPALSALDVRQKILSGARQVWQGTSVETGKWQRSMTVDPVTTQYVPTQEDRIFRFRALDAPASVDVDTEISWPLNMLNCHKAWEITQGQDVVIAVTDGGFHLKHPDFVGHVKTTKCFGPRSFQDPDQDFHGTEMSRIALSVAPKANLIPILCSAERVTDLSATITRSFTFAAQQEVDVISASWSGQFRVNHNLLDAIMDAVSSGVVVSWFHYPNSHAGVLRPRYLYAWMQKGTGIGLSDRFLTDSPGFHPVEIEAGLSNTAPQAAGLAALAKSVNHKLTPEQICRIIWENSTPISDRIRIPDAYRIVLAAQGSTTQSPD